MGRSPRLFSSAALTALALCVIACDDAGGAAGGQGAGSADSGVQEGIVPLAGRYTTTPPAIAFELNADKTLSAVDLDLACTCEGVDETLTGRVEGGGALDEDGASLRPIVNSAASLRVEGRFVSPTRCEGTYDFKCCTDVPWVATAAAPAEPLPPGVCAGQPAGAAVPVRTTARGATLHWAEPTRCIALTASADLDALRADLEAAGAAWSNIACSTLCFEPLGLSDSAPTRAADRRVHLQRPDAENPIPEGSLAQTRVLLEQDTGIIRGGVIALSPALPPERARAEALRQLGRALGFDQAADDADSTLSAGSARVEPSALDAASICALYGDPPYCADPAPPPPAPLIPLDYPVPDVCWDDLAPGEATVFIEDIGAHTEGISFGPDGGLYVSVLDGGPLLRVHADGTTTPFAQVTAPLGLAALADGRLVVAQIGESYEAGLIDGGVLLVDAAGQVTQLTDQLANPNFALALPNGDLLLADDFDTRVWRVTPAGEVSEQIVDFPSPNGMALDPLKQRMYVVSTFSPEGEIGAYTLGADGLPDPATRRTLFKLGAAQTMDGVAVDANDQLYVAASLPGKVLRVRGDGTGEAVAVAQGLTTPASMAFGRAPDFDPCSLYVTSIRDNRIWRVAVGAQGASLP